MVFRKAFLPVMVLVLALTFAACDTGNKKDAFSTENVKKFVENSKKKGTMSKDKVKDALKSIFPNNKKYKNY